MKSLLALLGLALLLPAGPALAQQVTVASTTPGVVWTYSAGGCGSTGPTNPSTDYSDVPARPFLVGPGVGTVLWFASNSSGNWASVGVGAPPDILANLQRGTARGAGCVNWLPPASYPGSTPDSYNTGLWMVAPFTPDGVTIQALVHNEFHGEWTVKPPAQNSWCTTTIPTIYLPCNYWNIVSASSTDGGNSFQLLQGTPGVNVPAIAINQPYQQGPSAPLLPQGMTAQSNIVQQGGFYYVLVQQLPRPPSTAPNSVCMYQAAVPAQPGSPLTWWGWVSPVFGLRVPAGYPPVKGPLSAGCEPVLGSQFRFSWSFNTVLNQLIIIGQDDKNSPGKYPNCPYAPGASAATSDAAFVYMTATLSPMMSGIFNFPLIIGKTETCLLQTNSIGNWAGNPSFPGQAYPSLLDPTSPQLMPGDRNFQYSGARPFLYYTRLNATSTGRPSNDRDLVRVQLNVSP